MQKATFDPKGVTSTLIDRVHRTGVLMMSAMNSAKTKADSVAPKQIDSLQTDYLLANTELGTTIKTQLASGDRSGWDDLSGAISKLDDAQKPIFRGVLGDVKQAAANVIAGSANPLDTLDFNLPSYMIPGLPAVNNPDTAFWKGVFADAESLQAQSRDVGDDLADAAGHAALATTEAIAGEPIGACVEAFNTGYAIGTAINHYMGWTQ